MAKKKTNKSELKVEKKYSLSDDLEIVRLPFMLFTGFSAVIEEMNNKNFEYAGIYGEESSTFLFRSEKEKEHVTINVTKDNLLIKQFSELEDDKKKLKVLYVVKDSGRKFKLL